MPFEMSLIQPNCNYLSYPIPEPKQLVQIEMSYYIQTLPLFIMSEVLIFSLFLFMI